MSVKSIKPSLLPVSFNIWEFLIRLFSKTKYILLICIIPAVYVAWSLREWDAILTETRLNPELRPVLLLLGDSLTDFGMDRKAKGWITLLEDEYSQGVTVVPRGLSGYNTRWYLKYAMPIIRGEIISGIYTPALVTLWLGANDAALPLGSSRERHVPVENYQQNLIEIVREFQTLVPDLKILFITTPHVDDIERRRRNEKNKGDRKGLIDRTNEMAGNYANACVETAHKLGLPVLDLYSFFNEMPEEKRNKVLEDGLHFNAIGNAVMYVKLREKIKAEFPEVVHRIKKRQFPDADNLLESDPWVPDDTNSTRTLRMSP